MSDVDVALQLAQQILAVFRTSGATQIEQYAALGVVRELVPLTDASLVTASSVAARDDQTTDEP